MTIEIIGTNLNKGVVMITALDVSEENLQRLERIRDDGNEKELNFVFDTSLSDDFICLRRWMLKQKATDGCKTWSDALASIIGIQTDSYGIGKYRAWD